MKKNMGKTDRIVRTVIAVLLGFLLWNGTISGTLGTVLTVVAIAFLVTSAIAWCPAYMPFGISTDKQSGSTG
jgi:uncharacterized membrane protein YkgB